MTAPASSNDAARRQRIRRTAWVFGACALLAYAAFLFSAMRA